MPELFTLQQQYKDDLVVIAVHSPLAASLAEAYEKSAALRRRAWPGNGEAPFRVALDGGSNRPGAEKPQEGFMAAYGVTGVPCTLLIDRDGVLVQRFWHPGVPEFREELAKAIRKKPATR
jgi:hypothetical protein